jgi:VanZ family protein
MTKIIRMRRYRYYLPAFIWLMLILILCLLPGGTFEVGSFQSILQLDKLAHMILFGVTVILIAYGSYRKHQKLSWGKLTLITLLTASYGLLIEFFQRSFTTSRSFDWYDFLADLIGAILGALIFQLIGKRFIKP